MDLDDFEELSGYFIVLAAGGIAAALGCAIVAKCLSNCGSVLRGDFREEIRLRQEHLKRKLEEKDKAKERTARSVEEPPAEASESPSESEPKNKGEDVV